MKTHQCSICNKEKDGTEFNISSIQQNKPICLDCWLIGGICLQCGNPCSHVGGINNIGYIKSYCCHCFAPQDSGYTEEHYCGLCTTRIPKKERKKVWLWFYYLLRKKSVKY